MAAQTAPDRPSRPPSSSIVPAKPVTHFVPVEPAVDSSASGRMPHGLMLSPEQPAMRLAQRQWALTSVRERLRVIRRLRHLIAARSGKLVSAIHIPGRTSDQTLVSEVVPLVEACRFLERSAGKLLHPVRWGRKFRPLPLLGTRLEIHRQPLGVVLVIGPSNYPLLLTAVQAIQALTAGNAAIIKPGRGGRPVAAELAGLLIEAGLDANLISVLDESPQDAQNAIAAGVDKVFLTGSTQTGKAVLRELAGRLVPATMELSGCDAVFVRADADLALAARAIRFGLCFNNSATCTAPRRVFVHRSVAAGLQERLAWELADHPAMRIDPATVDVVRPLVEQALRAGARIVVGSVPGDEMMRPLVLADAGVEMPLLQADLFAPVISLVTVVDDRHALEADRRCPYALGASVFGAERPARELASRIDAGAMIINDVLAPMADPRLPFGGGRASGFGVTRGAEGLLEMTRIKAVSVRRRFRPHLDPVDPADHELFQSYLEMAHGESFMQRVRAFFGLISAMRRHGRRRKAIAQSSAVTPAMASKQELRR